LVSAVDLVRGLGVLTGMSIARVEGITGFYDTNYEGKRDAALDALRAGTDLFVIHVEATDEAGHEGDIEQKVVALENWDRRILAPLVDALDAEYGEAGDRSGWRILLVPDHPTPLRAKTHTDEPVPYLIVDWQGGGPGGEYTEAATAQCTPLPGHALMGRLVGAR
jgi:2,3-bisphosphoglycerate-independent phosphoglycerate mutase